MSNNWLHLFDHIIANNNILDLKKEIIAAMTYLPGTPADMSEDTQKKNADAVTVQDLATSVVKISLGLSDMTKISDTTLGTASQLCADMRNLAEKAREIGSLIDLMKTIAGQAHVLALHAKQITSTPHLDQLKGLVSTEAQNFSDYTKQATLDIETEIESTQMSILIASSALEKAVASIEKIMSGTVNEAVTRIESMQQSIITVHEKKTGS